MRKPSGRKTSQFQLSNARPQPQVPSVQNNFTGGLKTEYTGLNFPENACTATENCLFTRVGNVTRRNGIDFEFNNSFPIVQDRTTAAISNFLWKNAGGDGNSEIFVAQVGTRVYFFLSSASTIGTPLSNNFINTPVSLTLFTAQGATFDATQECQYAFGDGYLFIFHPNCDPIYCTYASGVVTPNVININIRDFVGISDNLPVNFRPSTLSPEHQYNLQNQGWSSGSPWTALSANNVTFTYSTGSQVFSLTSSGATLSNGDIVHVSTHAPNSIFNNAGSFLYFNQGLDLYGTVTAFTANVSVTLNITSINSSPALTSGTIYKISGGSSVFNSSSGTQPAFAFNKINAGFINTWFSAEGNYPANSDIWYLFKDSTGVFNPSTTQVNVALAAGQAPQGGYILNAFNQNRAAASGLAVTNTTTFKRPSTGAWFQGRVWYTGINDTQAATGDAFQYTWTENIYFSQIVTDVTSFGNCYQNNDPTNEFINTLLPTDGGVIQIQGSGSIYKLFPVTNGILVFAANGIWFITGDTGLGFTANDFSVTKLSGEHSISSTSFVDVKGYPIFWNADAIYYVSPGQTLTSGQRGLEVKNLTLETIKQFYQAIPLSSKKKARGSYNHITGEIRWLYLSTESTGTLNTYSFDSILSFLTYTGAFYPWSLPNGSVGTTPYLNGIIYVEGPGGLNVTPPQFKYFTSAPEGGQFNYTFSEERDQTNWVDFISFNQTGFSYTSTFTTAYNLKGQGQRRFQPEYIWIYSEIPAYSYILQGTWDYAGDINSNRFSTQQIVKINKSHFSKAIRKHRIRGSGYVCQYKISSISGQPFNISGWSVLDMISAGL